MKCAKVEAYSVEYYRLPGILTLTDFSRYDFKSKNWQINVTIIQEDFNF